MNLVSGPPLSDYREYEHFHLSVVARFRLYALYLSQRHCQLALVYMLFCVSYLTCGVLQKEITGDNFPSFVKHRNEIVL